MILSLLLSMAFAAPAQNADPCLGQRKTFTFADDKSKFKTITFARADKPMSGEIQIDAGQPGRALTLQCDSLRPKEKTASNPALMNTIHPLASLHGEADPLVLSDTDENKLIESKITIHRSDSYAELTDVNWGEGVSVRVYCGFAPGDHNKRVATLDIYKNGKPVLSFPQPGKNSDSTPTPNCTSSAQYEISMKDTKITQTSSGLPTPRTSPAAPSFGTH